MNDDELLEFTSSFSKMFLSVINTVYDDFVRLPPSKKESLICQPFSIGESRIPDTSINYALRELTRIGNGVGNSFRLYKQNVVFIIMLDSPSNWTRGQGMDIADQVFAYMVEQEYNL